MASLPVPLLGNPEYRHLIDFVRPGHSGSTLTTTRLQHSVPSTASAISGEEAKSFYEELCQEKVSDDKVNSSTRKRKCGSRQKMRHGKRTHNGNMDSCDIQIQLQLAKNTSVVHQADLKYDRTVCNVQLQDETNSEAEIVSACSSPCSTVTTVSTWLGPKRVVQNTLEV